jgi:hypothetical protein
VVRKIFGRNDGEMGEELRIIHTENFKTYNGSRDSSAGIALGYGLEDRDFRVRFPATAGNLSLHCRVQNDSGAHPASYPMDSRALSLGEKRPGREADHSSPSSAEVKDCVKLYLHSPIRLHGMVLKHRENFNFANTTRSKSKSLTVS